MGGGPDHEHLLIVLWSPEPKDLISKIKQRFPYIDVTYFQVQSTRANKVQEAEKGVPKGSSLPQFHNDLFSSRTEFLMSEPSSSCYTPALGQTGYSDGTIRCTDNVCLQSFGSPRQLSSPCLSFHRVRQTALSTIP